MFGCLVMVRNLFFLFFFFFLFLRNIWRIISWTVAEVNWILSACERFRVSRVLKWMGLTRMGELYRLCLKCYLSKKKKWKKSDRLFPCARAHRHMHTQLATFTEEKIIIFCFPKEPCDILNPTAKPSSVSVDLLLQCFKDGTEWIIANTLTEKRLWAGGRGGGVLVKGYKLPNTTVWPASLTSPQKPRVTTRPFSGPLQHETAGTWVTALTQSEWEYWKI